MEYKCCFPGCTYTTTNRSLIEYHHIHPRELRVQHSRNVTIPLCATHHKMIYHPDATSGQHTEKTPDSMIVKTVTTSNTGKCVIFQDMAGNDYTVQIGEAKPSALAVYMLSWNIINGIRKTIVDNIPPEAEHDIEAYGIYKDKSTVYYTEEYKTAAITHIYTYMLDYEMKMNTEFAEARKRMDEHKMELITYKLG